MRDLYDIRNDIEMLDNEFFGENYDDSAESWMEYMQKRKVLEEELEAWFG